MVSCGCLVPGLVFASKYQRRDIASKGVHFGRGTMSDMPVHNPYRPHPFLEGIELKLKAKHTSAAYKAIHAIGRRVRRDYMESRYTSRAEAERAFRDLVEQDQTCKSCKSQGNSRC